MLEVWLLHLEKRSQFLVALQYQFVQQNASGNSVEIVEVDMEKIFLQGFQVIKLEFVG